ncbi:MAG: hypothetical protein FGM34_02165 [Solirubrobacteraceae bacterium]|nr:hypothetical protein [Solirubrobacteraceae bacterium]
MIALTLSVPLAARVRSRQASPARRGDCRRIRRAGGPDDHALYTCGCGAAFDSEVGTAVCCPHCGCCQDW